MYYNLCKSAIWFILYMIFLIWTVYEKCFIGIIMFSLQMFIFAIINYINIELVLFCIDIPESSSSIQTFQPWDIANTNFFLISAWNAWLNTYHECVTLHYIWVPLCIAEYCDIIFNVSCEKTCPTVIILLYR